MKFHQSQRLVWLGSMTVAAGFPWEKQFRFPIRNGLNAHNKKSQLKPNINVVAFLKQIVIQKSFIFKFSTWSFFGKHTDKVSTGHVLQQCFPTSILMNTNIKKTCSITAMTHALNLTFSSSPPPPHPLKIIVQMYVQFTQNMLKHNFPTDSMSNLHQLNNKQHYNHCTKQKHSMLTLCIQHICETLKGSVLVSVSNLKSDSNDITAITLELFELTTQTLLVWWP